MEQHLDIYRNSTFDGCIYVKISSRSDIQSASVQLLKNGAVVAEKDAPQKFVRFKNNEPGLYKSIAVLTLTDGTPVNMASPEIAIVEQAVDPRAALLPPAQNPKGCHTFYDNVETHYLEATLEKGCLERLSTESPSVISKFHGLKSHMEISKISLKAFWEDDSDEEDCDRCTIKCTVSNAELVALAQELEALDYVIYCTVVPDTRTMMPPEIPAKFAQEPEHIDTPNTPEAASTTPSFRHLQTYLNPRPGMNVLEAWRAGETGQAASARLIDFGVFRNHENLVGNITVVHSRPESDPYVDHGTASTGCIAARNTTFGMVGIAHDCNFFFYDSGDIHLIARDAVPGDIVAINNQFLVDTRLVPMTDSLYWWNHIRILSNRGVTVILSAGNGGLNLSIASGNMVQHGDSGSMLVGACDANTGRRLGFSNHSHPTSLINSWGHYVATTGYGDLQNLGNNRSYTRNFNGTSSATPLSCGALALIQSSYIKTGNFLSPLAMRPLLQSTGYPEALQDGMGHRPDARRALRLSQYLRMNTQVQMDQLGLPNGGGADVIVSLLRTHPGLDILASDNAWTSRIHLPHPSNVERGRIIIFATQAQSPTTLLFHNEQLVLRQGDSIRLVAEGSLWRRA